MPHDGPHNPTLFQRYPRLVAAFYLLLVMVAVTWLAALFGPDWVAAKLDALFEWALLRFGQ